MFLVIFLLVLDAFAISTINKQQTQVINEPSIKQSLIESKSISEPIECNGEKCATASMIVEVNLLFGDK